MKKAIIVVTILTVLLFSFTTGAYGAHGPKDIAVTLSDPPTSMKVGETIELTATCDKHGSDYIDSWDYAAETSSVFDPETETYVSKAIFTAEKAGTYVIRYSIEMTAGNSSTIFSGVAEKTIEVIAPAPVTVAGAQIRDLSVQPVYRTDGTISSYKAAGKVYTLWSDSSATLYGSIYFNFGPGETGKDVRVTMNINGKAYVYMVSVTR